MSIREAKAALVKAVGNTMQVMNVTMQYGGEKRRNQIVTMTVKQPGGVVEDLVLTLDPGADVVNALQEYGAKYAAQSNVAQRQKTPAEEITDGKR
jgi:hypothetical protein